MILADKLSAELKIDYMDLYEKTNKYHFDTRLISYREDKRLPKVFSEKDIYFLACVALEYLKDKGIDSPLDIDKLKK